MMSKNKNSNLLQKSLSFRGLENSSLTVSDIVADEIQYSPHVLSKNCHFIKIDSIGYDEKDKMPRREPLQKG